VNSRVESIVNAVLYEGYLLYPYRPSSVKNRQRWTFGGVYPPAYCRLHEGELWSMQTECLVSAREQTTLAVRIGFLHLVQRDAGRLHTPARDWPAQSTREPMPDYETVEMLEIGDKRYYTWQEAVARQVEIAPARVRDLVARARADAFAFAGHHDLEPLQDGAGIVRGVLARTQRRLEGSVEVRAEPIAAHTVKVRVTIANLTALDAAGLNREAASLHALVACHTILNVRDGEFISLLDPPAQLKSAAAACRNVGTYPVLAGAEGTRDTLLSSPIILYDYPQIAEESPGDLFDATEIDEILTLRILSMTDQEKQEMAATDERARALLERTETLAPEQLQRLHGTRRTLRPAPAPVALEPPPWEAALPQLAYLSLPGAHLRVGDQVRLRPRPQADILDLALAGKLATIEAIERDFEDRVHVAVTIDDDPGREFGLQRMPGHRFFFAPDEVEPVSGRKHAG